MKKYKVEAFITPTNSKNESGVNQIDDVKLANKIKDSSSSSQDESSILSIDEDVQESNNVSFNKSEHLQSKIENNESASEFSEVFFEINEHIYDEIKIPEIKNKSNIEIKTEKITTEYAKATLKIEEQIYDEPFVGTIATLNKRNNENNYDVPQANWMLGSSKYRRFGIVAPKLPKRSSSLKSIIEDNESFEDTLPELCCHGNKYGCLPSSQRPEDISEEIFKENWMQRLNALRKLETLLKDKEVALQSRERLLFKKEKELRILEKLVKDKMKQAELYAKRCKKSSSSENICHERNSESRSSNSSKDFNKCEFSSNSLHLTAKSISKATLESKDELFFKNPPNSRSSIIANNLDTRGNSMRSRSRPRWKKNFDDLDSTLSADIGDSSFVITSRKFDPEIFRKPTAFIRSASERRPKLEQNAVQPVLSSLIEKDEQIFLSKIEENTLKKISENILASQDQATKFLNYGPIDNKSEVELSNADSKESINQKRCSYLNLESSRKPVKSNPVSKQRPMSWSENTDDWLLRKRQAYNLATKKLLLENSQEKENFDRQTKINKSIKVSKKKENSHKKFSIFR